jgi:hypothetical protein
MSYRDSEAEPLMPRCPRCRGLLAVTTHDGRLVERCESCAVIWPIRTRRNVPVTEKKGASANRGPRGPYKRDGDAE